MTEPAAAPENAPKKAQFAIQRLYTKDVSFESPGAPAVFTQAWEPEVNVQFGSATTRISDKQYEVTLHITVTSTVQGKSAFIAEVKYAGIFHIEGLDAAQLDHALGAHCPNILFPYVREVVSDLVVRGTFPPFVLQPMNFDAIYLDAKRRREQEAVGAAEIAAKH